QRQRHAGAMAALQQLETAASGADVAALQRGLDRAGLHAGTLQALDEAVAKVGNRVDDWSGGTRIGHCLHTFNNQWSRRVLTQGPVVLLITDGLDREAGAGLTQEMARLHRSCRHLIWLNPLLRYDGFEPKSLGIRAILPHVDDFRPVHSLASLEQLVDVLAGPPVAGNKAIAPWLERMRETAPPNAQPESEAHQESDQ
ncbi:MAG: VWA domain-containing protein, partial [Pseudomonadota bacterium]|nr:VWA domain-containing protein [Pseudomonadota bacterium]